MSPCRLARRGFSEALRETAIVVRPAFNADLIIGIKYITANDLENRDWPR
jgi:hypothetical protein